MNPLIMCKQQHAAEEKMSLRSDHKTRHKRIMNKNTHFCFPHFMFSRGARKFKIRMSCALLSLILTGEKQNLPASHCKSRSRSPKTQQWLTSLLWRLDLCPPAHPHRRMQRASTPSCSKYWNTGTVSSRIPRTHLSNPPFLFSPLTPY